MNDARRRRCGGARAVACFSSAARTPFNGKLVEETCRNELCALSCETAAVTLWIDPMSSFSEAENSPCSFARIAEAVSRAAWSSSTSLISRSIVDFNSADFAPYSSMSAESPSMAFLAAATAAVFSFSLVVHQQLSWSYSSSSSFCSVSSLLLVGLHASRAQRVSRPEDLGSAERHGEERLE